MSHGPGKYDAECTAARESAKAIGAILIIIGGTKGSSFCVQAPLAETRTLPRVLRAMADQIEKDLPPVLSMWTVYNSPDDYPGMFVARRWEILEMETPTGDVIARRTLDELRAELPPGLTMLHRAQDDDPKIVETWL